MLHVYFATRRRGSILFTLGHFSTSAIAIRRFYRIRGKVNIFLLNWPNAVKFNKTLDIPVSDRFTEIIYISE